MALYIDNKNWIVRANNQSYAAQYFSEIPQKFTIEDKTYLFKMGMTWAEWVASEYNTDDFFLWDNGIRVGDLDWIADKQGDVAANALITLDTNYKRKMAELPTAEYIRYESINVASDLGSAYIDLGFAFDTAAVVKLKYDMIREYGYLFGAAEDNGRYRCLISHLSVTGETLKTMGYGSNGKAYTEAFVSSGINREYDIIFTLRNGLLRIEDLNTGEISERQDQIAYTMTNNLYLGAQNYNSAMRYGGQFAYHSFNYYDKNNRLICALVPCKQRATGKIGAYDIIRKQFFSSIGSAEFRGAPAQSELKVKNWVRYSTEDDGVTIYNNGRGYKNCTRVRSGGTEAFQYSSACTGYIPFTKADKLYIFPHFIGSNTSNAINYYDSNFNCLGQRTNSGGNYGFCNSSFATQIVNGVTVLDLSAAKAQSGSGCTIDDIAYVRVSNDITEAGNSLSLISHGSEMIISKNEEIDITSF